MRLDPKNTMAIAVDYQEKLIPAIDEHEEVVRQSVKLLTGLKELGIPVLVSQQYTKGLWPTISPIRSVLGEDMMYWEKSTFSLLQTPEIKTAIYRMQKRNIILCGTECHICVMQTALDLLEEHFNVYVPVDCVGSRKPLDKKYGCKRMAQEGAFYATSESLLYELTSGAQNPHFKAISKLTK